MKCRGLFSVRILLILPFIQFFSLNSLKLSRQFLVSIINNVFFFLKNVLSLKGLLHLILQVRCKKRVKHL